MIIGAAVFGYIIGNVAVIMENFDVVDAIETSKMNQIKDWLYDRKVIERKEANQQEKMIRHSYGYSLLLYSRCCYRHRRRRRRCCCGYCYCCCCSCSYICPPSPFLTCRLPNTRNLASILCEHHTVHTALSHFKPNVHAFTSYFDVA